jgi:hypothetical protein
MILWANDVTPAPPSLAPSPGRPSAVSPAYLSQRLTRPLPTKDGGTLRTVLDARTYMLRLSKGRERSARWQRAAELLPAEADVGALTKQVELTPFFEAKLDPTAIARRRSTACMSGWLVSALASPIRSAPSCWSVALPYVRACASYARSYHAFSLCPARLAFAPYGREPQLLLVRKSRRAVVVSHLEEPGSSNVIAPGVEIEETAIAAIAKAFLVVPSWV